MDMYNCKDIKIIKFWLLINFTYSTNQKLNYFRFLLKLDFWNLFYK